MRYVLMILLLIAIPVQASALTPVAHTDVVPYQRIAYGSSFKFGVMAFSETGIDRVEFTISGPGYTGGTKVVTTKQLNAQRGLTQSTVSKSYRPGLLAYSVKIASSEFTSDGEVIVSPTVYGSDGGVRILEAVPLIVEAAGPENPARALVDSAHGSDLASGVGNASLPVQTTGAAETVAQAARSSSADGNVIYYDKGTYALAGTAPSTARKWLTIKPADGAGRKRYPILNIK